MKWIVPILGKKEGNYFVEAALIMPIFISAMVVLLHVIPIIATCENIIYGVSEEMRMEVGKSAFRSNGVVLPVALSKRAKEENGKIDEFRMKRYRYGFTENNIDDLIYVEFSTKFHQPDPFGVFRKIGFTGKIKARKFTGTYYKEMDAGGERVYVFPEEGDCYHGRSCTHVQANCKQTYLTKAIQEEYDPCPNCRSGEAKIGTVIYCFSAYGKSYHLASCRSVTRYYVEVSRKEAKSSGYYPCSKCGGH